jgi:dTDP-4-dehydrorhamnose reductase
MPVYVIPDRTREERIGLPFWRIRIGLEGFSLSTFGDFARFCNLPRAITPAMEEAPFFFWVPAFKVNAEAVATMAGYAARHDALFVHYSTDYVFDGQKSGAYVETDATHPLGIYGLSKRRGEEAIVQSQCSALIFRTSWVFSAYGSNFIKTILRLAKEKNSLNIVADQFGAPTSAELIADVTALAIAGYRSGNIGSGIYHLTAGGAANWHQFAVHIVDRAIANGVPLPLNASKIPAITSEEYPVPAKRPKNSRLDTALISSRLGLQLPDWTVHANRTIDQLTLSHSS